LEEGAELLSESGGGSSRIMSVRSMSASVSVVRQSYKKTNKKPKTTTTKQQNKISKTKDTHRTDIHAHTDQQTNIGTKHALTLLLDTLS
jgi:NADH:ubiquinone oxidoreductase subunit D